MKLTIYQVDAFTKEVFKGNPAAVCPLDAWLPAETMRRVAAENNLSETAFFVKRDGVYEIRWFTPTTEVNLCGHATLASSFVIFNCLGETADVIQLRSQRSGQLRVEKKEDLLVLDFPRYGVKPETDEALVKAVGRRPQRMWETQGNMVVMLFEHESDVAALAPDMSALGEIEFDEVIATAQGETADFVSRMFAPRIGIPEDPVTGAIHCSLIPFWAARLGREKLFARQISARGGELFCEPEGERVKIGGHAALYCKAKFMFKTRLQKLVCVTATACGAALVGALALPPESLVSFARDGKKAVETADAPKAIGPYSQAVVAGDFVFLAGQIGLDPKTGQMVAGGTVEQTEQVMKNLEAVLKASKSDFDSVVKATIYLADINDFAAVNEVYGRRFKAPYPARATVEAARLPRDARVEIELTALVKK